MQITTFFAVPANVITGITEGQPSETSQSVTITLPLTPYQPAALFIVSTVNPPDIEPITAPFTNPSDQYTVTFNDLNDDTLYNFIMRIVLRTNNSVDVVPPATGSFRTLRAPSKFLQLAMYIFCICSPPHIS